MKKLVAWGSLLVLTAMTLVGCGSGAEISRLNSISALNTESSSNDVNLTLSEKQSMVYAQVSERTLLDLSRLQACSDTELQAVVTYMNSVDSQLTGQIKDKDGVIKSEFTDYLLSEFEKTPYYWQRSQTVVRGIDSASRSIVVDVYYNTIGFMKEAQENSYIVAGEPDYEKKLRIRKERWLKILSAKYSGSNRNWQAELNKFVQVYGQPEKIIESQRNLPLTGQIFESGNQKTYNGLIDSTTENQGASMCVRYVLVPRYAMGVNLGLDCKHMYVIDYSLASDPTEGQELMKEDGYTTVTHNVIEIMKSYFKCIDEHDLYGLYKLNYHFDKIDKYYQDMFDTTYTKHNNYTVSIFNVSGTKITCGVQVSSKVRAKGSNMSFPMYTDRYYVELQLVDDQLQISDIVLLSRRLEGEPAILTAEADSTGFVASIDLSNAAKQQLEQLICKFGELQLLKDTSSNNFMDIVDYSMSENKFNYLKENMLSLSGEKKVVWLQTYQNGTSNYASLKCKEQFQAADNSIVEAVVSYEFISKGSKWYLYGYDVISSVKLDTTNLTVANSLCTIEKGKTIEYVSQVASESNAQDTEAASGSSVSVSGVIYTHEMKIPKLKQGGESEKGLVTMSAKMISGSQIVAFVKNHDARKQVPNLSYDDILAEDEAAGRKPTEKTAMVYLLKEYTALDFNVVNNRLKPAEAKAKLDELKQLMNTAKASWVQTDVGTAVTQVLTSYAVR